METITKQIDEAFNKKVYLLGKTQQGRIWLEEATWDCDWYWGFGYVETYVRDAEPHRARDIDSHRHFDGLIWHQHNGHYIYHLNECPEFTATVLTDSEAWELSDLMKSFYTLRSTAEVFHQGNSHFTASAKVDLKDKSLNQHINQELLPKIFGRIYTILSPTNGG